MKLSIALAALFLAGACVPSQAAEAANPVLDKAAADDLYLGIVDGLIQQQRYEAAIAFLDRYGEKQGASQRYQLLRGNALVGAKRYDDAVAAFNLALKPGASAAAYNGIGQARAEQKSWRDAADNFRRATELDPTSAQYLNNLGYAEIQQKLAASQMTPTVTELKRAHELAPGSVLIRNNLILALTMSDDKAQAAGLLDAIGDAKERAAVAAFAADWTGEDTAKDAP